MSKKVDKSNMGPMPWQDFVLGFQVASTALGSSGETQPAPPDEEAASDHQPRAAVQRDPMVRVMLSTREHFGEAYPYHPTFIYRFWALMHLLRRGHIQQWITSSEINEFQSFHPAVLLAAAEVKLTNTARFPVKRFLARVEAIIEEEGGDDED